MMDESTEHKGVKGLNKHKVRLLTTQKKTHEVEIETEEPVEFKIAQEFAGKFTNEYDAPVGTEADMWVSVENGEDSLVNGATYTILMEPDGISFLAKKK